MVNRARMRHFRGVRQGDPLSPMLFLLAMEPLHKMFQLAQSMGLFHHLQQDCSNFQMSLYADDVTLFITPKLWDIKVARKILDIFGLASGLMTNMVKTEFYPIRCSGLNLSEVLGADQAGSQFPCTYLGLPLHFRKLPKQSIQPLVQKIANRIPGWKRDLLTYPGRELLIKTVLSAMPTYLLTIFELPAWAIK